MDPRTTLPFCSPHLLARQLCRMYISRQLLQERAPVQWGIPTRKSRKYAYLNYPISGCFLYVGAWSLSNSSLRLVLSTFRRTAEMTFLDLSVRGKLFLAGPWSHLWMIHWYLMSHLTITNVHVNSGNRRSCSTVIKTNIYKKDKTLLGV